MSVRVLFLTEAGNGIGYGHLSRCVALADGFKLLGCNITFIVRGTDGSVIKDREFAEQNEEWFDKGYLEEIIQEYDFTVTDSYQVSNERLNLISEVSKTPVFLIDSQLKHGNKGAILFPSVYAGEYTFGHRNHIKILSGIKYLLYTKEMWKEHQFETRKVVKRVGVSLGSSQPESAGLILESLNRTFSGLEQICVFGSLQISEFSDPCDGKIKWIGRLNKEYYLRELQNLDLLISNGGQTLNEALLIGLPVLPLVTADNQLENVVGWEKKNLVNGLDLRNRLDPNVLSNSLNDLRGFKTRKEFYKKCRHTVDSKGAIRAAKEILKLTSK